MEFKDLQINEQILNGIARKEFTTLTEIQEKVI